MDITYLLVITAVVIVAAILSLYRNNWINSFIAKLSVQSEYIIVIGLTKIGLRIALESKEQGKKVVVLSEDGENTFSDQLKSKGIQVINVKGVNESALKKAKIWSASSCLIVTSNEDHNINISNLISDIAKKDGLIKKLQLIVQVENWYSRNLLIDQVSAFNSTNNLSIKFFDFHHNSAKLVYDKYPPHKFVNDETRLNNEKVICVIGQNATAESFILENTILSQYQNDDQLKIMIFAKNAESWVNSIRQKFPFIDDYIKLEPIELLNSSFSNYESWSDTFKYNLLKIDAAYFFGYEDAEVISKSLYFKQFLYKQTGNLRNAPLIVVIPDNTSIFNLLSKGSNQNSSILDKYRDELLIHIVREVHDSCTYEHLISQNHIESQSKAINFFYSINYEFDYLLNEHFKKSDNRKVLNSIQEKYINFKIKKGAPLEQLEALVTDELVKYTKNSIYRVKQYFGIDESWNRVTERNKDSNRYIARHLPVKVAMLKELNIIEITRENLKSHMSNLAPIEHNRWSAEKFIAGFTNGQLPSNDNGLKKIIKNTLKIHDQVGKLEGMKNINQEKDIELFLIIPLLQKIKDNI
jgi:hypothetical protein